MTYVLDTSVISAFAPGRPPVPEALARWIQAEQANLFIAAISVAEIQQGICKLRRTAGPARADRLAVWLDELMSTFAHHILALDALTAREVGTLSDAIKAAGHAPGLADIVIAATASVHRFSVLTRNVKHFNPLTALGSSPAASIPSWDCPACCPDFTTPSSSGNPHRASVPRRRRSSAR